MTFWSRAGLVFVAWVTLVLACSSDLPTFGEGLFPPIGSSVLESYCIRGATANEGALEGSIATTDCHKGPGLGYWDAYRVRVTQDTRLNLEVQSEFDSQLELFRIDDLDDYWASRVQLAFDDDSGPGQDAALSEDFVPDVEYLFLISGADDFSRGPYTVLVTLGA